MRDFCLSVRMEFLRSSLRSLGSSSSSLESASSGSLSKSGSIPHVIPPSLCLYLILFLSLSSFSLCTCSTLLLYTSSFEIPILSTPLLSPSCGCSSSGPPNTNNFDDTPSLMWSPTCISMYLKAGMVCLLRKVPWVLPRS
eukprot:TRINITY_DN9993_c0_g1_i1.p2 TRINITY_DN9993_c0_g1~~TRINITY_DN9993_c0_g1_i1.p2  ORF type:complete len:140 (+),score=11.47 TRINITY_DN9993_c0_g1_i1:208-627(+)